MGLFSIDQEKAFDRVDDNSLFKTFEAFRFGETFISCMRLLYAGASGLLKVGGGLSPPVPLYRGVRQGRYSHEPLLLQLRQTVYQHMLMI